MRAGEIDTRRESWPTRAMKSYRRFSFRGLEKVRDEWSFVCATHNLLKLFRRGFRPLPAIAQA